MDGRSNVYDYEPLDARTSSIRILRLLKSKDGPIQCKMFNSNLSQEGSSCVESPQYEALSYAWGSNELVERIKVNKKTLWITDNLYAALQSLRYRHRDRLLWIDAICINQADNSERGHQVQHMAEIYRCARRVIFWLGKPEYAAVVLMKTLRKLEAINPDPDLETVSWLEISRNSKVIPTARRLELINQCSKGLQSLLGRPWWDRVWIVQEVANAKQGIVCTGKYHIPAHIFAFVAYQSNSPATVKRGPVLSLMPGPKGTGVSRKLQRDLGTLLVEFRDSKASDERDKIYALLGTASCQIAEDISVNYEESVPDVVYKCVRRLVNETDIEIDDLLNFLTTFKTLNAVCVIWSEGWTERWLDELYYRSQKDPRTMHGITNLEHIFRKLRFTRKSISIVIEQRDDSTTGAVKTFYGDVMELIDRTEPIKAKGVRGGKLVPKFWGKYDQNVKLLAIENVSGALIEACDSCCNRIAKMLLTGHDGVPDILASVNEKNKDGRSVLMQALNDGNNELAMMLLEFDDVEVNEVDEFLLQAPLHVAVEEGFNDIFRLLLKKDDIDINIKDKHGVTPLHLAITEFSEELVGLLLEKDDIEVNVKSNDRETPLHLAASMGFEEVVKLLLERDDIAVNIRGDGGFTPLHLASRYNKEGAVRLLLERDDIDPNMKSDYGTTPLHLAVEKRCGEVVRLLLERDDVDVNMRSEDGMTPLDYLLTDTKRELGSTPWGGAVRTNSEMAVRILLKKHNVDVNARDDQKETPLDWALTYWQSRMVKMLLAEDGIDINARNKTGRTLLHTAVSESSKQKVKLLLEVEDIDVGAKDNDGVTPLELAMRLEDSVMVDLLNSAVQRKANDGNLSRRP